MSLAGVPVDVLEARLWFWYFGHPLVYFWLVPAITLWYVLLPKVLGVEIFSKTMAKVALILYLIFSTPVGLHHQYVDPGLHPVFKYLHAALTYLVAVPSFLTAFNVIATLERAGRARGGKGLFGWVTALPWFKDPVFTGLAISIIVFGTGGFSGVINASFQVNYVVHNTMWIPGHFHTTVGTGVALSYLTASLLLIPLLFGRQILSTSAVKAAFALWFIGIMIFSVGGYISGLTGEPRRTYYTAVSQRSPAGRRPPPRPYEERRHRGHERRADLLDRRRDSAGHAVLLRPLRQEGGLLWRGQALAGARPRHQTRQLEALDRNRHRAYIDIILATCGRGLQPGAVARAASAAAGIG
jgi:heme/copper-type cytochrome/quinol oxidase subunit 1